MRLLPILSISMMLVAVAALSIAPAQSWNAQAHGNSMAVVGTWTTKITATIDIFTSAHNSGWHPVRGMPVLPHRLSSVCAGRLNTDNAALVHILSRST
jgi:hypothetical protein